MHIIQNLEKNCKATNFMGKKIKLKILLKEMVYLPYFFKILTSPTCITEYFKKYIISFKSKVLW